MFELIIFFTLAGDTSMIYSNEYPTDMDCAYNQGVWVQNYVENFDGKVLEFDSADVDGDGRYDLTTVQLVVSKGDEVGTMDVVCVGSKSELRVDR